MVIAKKFTILALSMIVLTVGGISALNRPKSTSSMSQSEDLVPAEDMRQKAHQIKVEEVAFIRLYGLNMGDLFGDHRQDITDTKLIAGFVEALRHAERKAPEPIPETPASNRSERFEIHFKQNVQVPWIFNIRIGTPSDSFGRPFAAMLGELGRYRAESLHTMLREHGRHLKTIEVPGYKTWRKPEEIKKWAVELNQVTGDAFHYTYMETHVPVLFNFDDKTHRVFYFVLPPLIDPDSGKPTTLHWPALLEECRRYQKQKYGF